VSSTIYAKNETKADNESVPKASPQVPVKMEQQGSVGNVYDSQNFHANAFVSSSFPAPVMQYNMPYGPPQMRAMPMYPPIMMPMAPYVLNSYQMHAMMGQPWSQPVPSTPIPKMTQPAVPKPTILHDDPLNPVSPFADTHELFSGEIAIYKEQGEPFGVSFKYESRSALVDP